MGEQHRKWSCSRLCKTSVRLKQRQFPRYHSDFRPRCANCLLHLYSIISIAWEWYMLPRAADDIAGLTPC